MNYLPAIEAVAAEHVRELNDQAARAAQVRAARMTGGRLASATTAKPAAGWSRHSRVWKRLTPRVS